MWFGTMWYIDKCSPRWACAASFSAYKLQMMFCQQLNTHRICQRLAKALIRLRVCAGWSEPLLVAHTTLFDSSRRGSNGVIYICPIRWIEYGNVTNYVTLPLSSTDSTHFSARGLGKQWAIDKMAHMSNLISIYTVYSFIFVSITFLPVLFQDV